MKRKKDAVLQLRMSKSMHADLCVVATALGYSLSEFMRQAALEKCEGLARWLESSSDASR